jgi:hypothetical protein
MVCCLSLAVAAELQQPGYAAPGLPAGRSQARADMAMDLLERAVQAGFCNVLQFNSDPDLEALRQLRRVRFNAALSHVSSRPAGGLCPAQLAQRLQAVACSRQ